jgi:transposase
MHYVGIDLHKRESQICIVDASGTVVDEQRIKTTKEAFEAMFRARARSRIVIESSCESEWVARVLENCGHEVVVADPSYAAMYGHRNRNVKTDKRDARALADAARTGLYRHAHRKSDEQRHRSSLLAVRAGLVRSRAKLITLARALVRRTGQRIRRGAVERFSFFVKELELADDVATELAPILAVLPALDAQIESLDAELEKVATQDPRTVAAQSMQCIGPVTSVAFVAHIDDARRFKTARQVSSYIGLVPREYSSGEKKRRGRITKAGNSQLRSLLVQAALRIRRSRSMSLAHLRAWSERIAARRGKKVAVVALARKLAMILFAIIRDGTLFHAPQLMSEVA